MTCKHILNNCQPMEKVLILSDSKSVLQALAKGGTRNRQRKQQAVLKTINNILKKNIEMSFLWVPSHTGMRGNDLADKEAGNATKNGLVTEMKLSSEEIKNKIKKKAIEKRQQKLEEYCKNHENSNPPFIFLNGHKNHTTPLPRTYQKIINRLLVGCPSCKYVEFKCHCGKKITVDHLLHEDCPQLPEMKEYQNLRDKYKLTLQDFLIPDKQLGTKPLRTLAKCIIESKATSWI